MCSSNNEKFRLAWENPVLKAHGLVNMAGTARKYGLDYTMFQVWAFSNHRDYDLVPHPKARELAFKNLKDQLTEFTFTEKEAELLIQLVQNLTRSPAGG